MVDVAFQCCLVRYFSLITQNYNLSLVVMKHILLSCCLALGHFFYLSLVAIGQPTTCPAPSPGAINCYQTARSSNGKPLTNWPPIPNQDCCNAVFMCQPLDFIDNGIVVPPGAPVGVLFPGCVQNELPPLGAGNCFQVNEKATTWYKFQIRPLNGGPTSPGSPAGKLRFKIIPLDALDDPNYDPSNDYGVINYGDTDYDFLLFNVSDLTGTDGSVCTKIKNSAGYGLANSIITTCNWTGTKGPTGLYEPGQGTATAQPGTSRFNRPIPVKVGEVYYLAIDNYSLNIQGYYLDMRGIEAIDDSSANISPGPTDPAVKNVLTTCPEAKIKIKFNSPVRCDSMKPAKLKILGANEPYVISSVVPEGGCNTFGIDSSFIVSFTPNVPDANLKITMTSMVKDICQSVVLMDTTSFELLDCTTPVQSQMGGQKNFRVVPNPTTGKFSIQSNRMQSPIRVSVLDATGKFLEGKDTAKDWESVDLSLFPTGLYFLIIQTDTTVESIRILKE